MCPWGRGDPGLFPTPLFAHAPLLFQNIARSTLHNWKTQKCAYPDCVKWLSEYTQHEPEDPLAAQAPAPASDKVQIKAKRPEEEEEGEEENRRASKASHGSATLHDLVITQKFPIVKEESRSRFSNPSVSFCSCPLFYRRLCARALCRCVSDQCTALKVDGSRCNFKKADEELGLCRR